jgi:hypothetical protein
MAKSASPSPTPSTSNMNVESTPPSSGPPQPNYTHVSAETLSLRTSNRRERNRIASQKCRARKSARLTYLEGRVAELEDEVRALRGAMGPTASAIPTAVGQGTSTPNLSPQSSLSSITSSRSLASVQSSSLASITSTSSMETIPDMEDEEDSMVDKLKRENETLKACMSKFESEWNAALTALGISVSAAGKPVDPAPPQSENKLTNSTVERSLTPSSQTPNSLATLIEAASHLTPQ